MELKFITSVSMRQLTKEITIMTVLATYPLLLGQTLQLRKQQRRWEIRVQPMNGRQPLGTSAMQKEPVR